MKRNRAAGSQRQQGLAIVEFAIVLPLLLILLLATAEFGRALYQYNTLTKAARDAARYLSENIYVGQSLMIDNDGIAATESLVVCGQTNGCNSDNALLPGLIADNVDAGNERVTSSTNSCVQDTDIEHVCVQATYTYQPMTGQALPDLLNSTLDMNLDLTATVVMRVL